MMSLNGLLLALALGAAAGQGWIAGVASPERIAVKKCAEYRKLTVKTSTLITLSLRPTAISFEDYKCPNVVDLIVGGEAARRGEFPHQALIGYQAESDPRKIEFKCGGSLISERFVLTAAHCLSGAKPVVVRLGENDLRDEDDDQVDFDIEAIVRHPEYTIRRAYHDVALVKLAQNVIFTRQIRPACLWTGHNLNISSAIATGFGRTEFDGSTSDVLMKVQLDVLDKAECNGFTTSRKFKMGLIEGQLCVGSHSGGKDTCQGDSGGPLETVTEEKGCMFHIVGITSVGSACGYGKSPAIYTRVSSYVDWIEKVVWELD
ncbi:hypothetical protein pipiens_009798 [Culex pipiens pipiens]|uniref:Peptidase S1 domain-containing protein n=2 Tax=Culex pipiens TaxID=7175 RepID=A0ABD1DCJ1_CULPP